MAALKDLATEERRDLADFLDTLTDDEWTRPSLCPGWSVRDVAGHVPSYDLLGWPALLSLFARSRFSLSRCNQAGVDRSRRQSTDELVATLRAHAVPRGVTTMFGSAIALTDAVIHHQDIRRALDRPRVVPEERLVAALDFTPRARALPAPTNIRGLRAVATDVDWSHGTGPEVRGPGEAILVALAGRESGLADLTGPGLDILAARLRR
ncbi:maleylpyruvate isomerase family mycothiol-dependent enzyme [Speluncibacter jeojiensis]|uniref:Maleylpyruvate isomerase family mycothiol-dependent enzyme n=1 Tax=Speluncibacter jeojiensis TaxID=2710754 RepID=A0A9X4M750_9ACTN|nr:maleylpyruvate isomerase family mycothiol-dependent enzyme [Corynebacteriales bacterium D3-21]